ncbi:unnamed protein product [Amoebophrya sp. A120]|nr:unnamed protein product [Amoebophrya sp. A120]|eukprot:GSA120T00009083001.1
MSRGLLPLLASSMPAVGGGAEILARRVIDVPAEGGRIAARRLSVIGRAAAFASWIRSAPAPRRGSRGCTPARHSRPGATNFHHERGDLYRNEKASGCSVAAAGFDAFPRCFP